MRDGESKVSVVAVDLERARRRVRSTTLEPAREAIGRVAHGDELADPQLRGRAARLGRAGGRANAW